MNNLKELIEHLYIEVTRQPSVADPWSDEETSRPAPTGNADLDIERLRRTLQQMTAVLQKDDLVDQLDPSPLQADEAIRLMTQWEGICSSIEGLNRHIQELDADIARMHPWGDFDVVKLEQLRQHDCHIRFWTMPLSVYATQSAEAWFIDHQATLVSQDTADAYFVTISLGDERPQMPTAAHEVEICPCPVSTLIMLQTRDKDSLKRLQTRQDDFALAHYAELLSTFKAIMPDGITVPSHQHHHTQNLRLRLRKLFKK